MMAVRIKKYANRKLYDEEASLYLSMLDVSNLATITSNIRVTCDRTGKDITLETLSRALYERLKACAAEAEDGDATDPGLVFPFPVAGLTRLIAKVKLAKKMRKNARGGVKKSSGKTH
jgi:hypothetical protein